MCVCARAQALGGVVLETEHTPCSAAFESVFALDLWNPSRPKIPTCSSRSGVAFFFAVDSGASGGAFVVVWGSLVKYLVWNYMSVQLF